MNKQNVERENLHISNGLFFPEVVRLLNEGYSVTIPLKGYSMRPFLESGRDKAVLKKPSSISVGEPVLCETFPKHFVLHRIISIQGDNITLLGDGNIVTETCKRDNVVGAVVGFYRKGRESLDKTTGRKWKIYSALWMFLRPIRRYLLGIYSHVWIPLFGTI